LDILIPIAIFAGKALIIVLALLVIIGFIIVMAAKSKHHETLDIEVVNRHYKDLERHLKSVSMTESQWKDEKKALKKDKKNKKEEKPKLYVLDFEGDIKASQVDSFREEVTALLTTATPTDEVVIRLESPGGVVHGYGLAASQMLRIREKNIPLTACVDKVAASGGYLMACTANKILCSPFGIVGSVGVVAQVPNFNRLLKKHDVEYKEYTAGEFKRTVSLFGEITPKGEQKFIEQLEDTHHLFKNFVHQFRPQMDMHKVATGEYWYGKNAKDLGLVDEIMTSDAYLMEKAKTHKIIKLKFNKKQPWSEKFTGFMGQALEKAYFRVVSELEKSRLI
jgi:serine protease SohB